MSSLIGTTIGGYEIKEQLGQGGMGAVFLAVKDGGPAVALKLLHVRADDEMQLASKRFLDEATAAKAVDSEFLVPIIDSGLDLERGPYIVYQYVRGGSLRDRLEELGQLDEEEVVSVLAPALLGALQALHDNSVFHRDVKPENILYGNNGEYYLADLGLVTFEGRKAKTRTGTFVGTPGYLAPERIASESCEQGPEVDVYAAAIVLVEALTGKRPFRGKNPIEVIKEQLRREFKSSELVALGVPAHLAIALADGLALKPEKRIKNCRTFLKNIKACSKSLPKVTKRKVLPTENETEHKSLKRLVAAVFSIVLLGCIIFSWQHSAQRLDSNSPKQITLTKRFDKWAEEIKELAKEKGNSKKQLGQLRDIHRSFHRMKKGSEELSQRATLFELELLRAFYQNDLSSSVFIDETIISSMRFLYFLPTEFRQEPTWSACFHLHLLLRLKSAVESKATLSASTIAQCVAEHPLAEGLESEYVDFIKSVHATFSVEPPLFLSDSERKEKQEGIFQEEMASLFETIKLGKKLDLRGLADFERHTYDELTRVRGMRDDYCRKLLRAFWRSKTGSQAEALSFGAGLRHIRLIRDVIRARMGRSSYLLANEDFDWGPGVSENLIDELIVLFQFIAKKSSGIQGTESWHLQKEVFDVTKNLLMNLKGPPMQRFKKALNDEVLPRFSKDSPVLYLIKANQLLLQLVAGISEEKTKEIYRLALPLSSRAYELIKKELFHENDLTRWQHAHWTLLRRTLIIRRKLLRAASLKPVLIKEAAELERFIEANQDHQDGDVKRKLKNLFLAAALMRAEASSLDGENISENLVEVFEHAEKNPKIYDGRLRQEALIKMGLQLDFSDN